MVLLTSSISTLPSRNKILKLLTNYSLIDHQIAVADISLKIGERMKADGKRLDLKALEVGALLHDLGLTMYDQGDTPYHCKVGGDLVRKLGFPEEVARTVECHDMGLTRDEAKELRFPPDFCAADHVPKTWEEKIVCYADVMIHAVAYLGLDPWNDPEAPAKALYDYVNEVHEKYAGHGISMEHPILQRFNALNQELKKYTNPSDYEGLENSFPPGPLNPDVLRSIVSELQKS